MELIRRIRPEKTGVRAPLGDLEQAVMRCVWSCGDEGCLAAEVQHRLEKERPVALTTVITTMDRLKDKGILLREKEGKANRYRPALSETELEQRIVSGVLGDLIAQFPQAVAAYFAQPTSPSMPTDGSESELDTLARRLAEIRARNQGESTSDTSDNEAGG